ncbi:sugar phosphate nucleotidyltransferase [Cohnella caldifontis]|uniref:sugar phosphate nucleotidyltransferase n=1 Tax=Cohnella caldifontis TaxID=3027471 RepID=UPI0023EC9467|nr:sugar phosphate nucleotidyltransferase [Cohnella sp. YIM B05605]
MKLILLSGGSGKRLWPLSNDSRSKQFLQVLKSPDGAAESMVQRVWRQIQTAGLAESVYISTSREHAEAIRHQLGEGIPLILEPERRDTFPAIALSAVYLFDKEGVKADETACVMPVDCFVEPLFFEKVRELESLLEKKGARLGVIGAAPTYPSQKYGYLLPAEEAASVDSSEGISIRRFAEKPDEETAVRLIRQNALWNCGVFAFRLSTVLDELRRNGWPDRYDELCESYGTLPKTSFDYQVAEKAESIVALAYEGKWKDLGTWNTLTEEMDSFALGEGIVAEDAADTHVVNELPVPVAVLGTRGLVVACSPDGILVADKGASHRLKDLAERFPGAPMYEEHRWGWRRVLEHAVYPSGGESLIQKLAVRAGHRLDRPSGRPSRRLWKVLSGEGAFTLGERTGPLRPGDFLVIPERTGHGLSAAVDMEVVEIMTGIHLRSEAGT